jgi:hypothetical protein
MITRIELLLALLSKRRTMRRTGAAVIVSFENLGQATIVVESSSGLIPGSFAASGLFLNRARCPNWEKKEDFFAVVVGCRVLLILLPMISQLPGSTDLDRQGAVLPSYTIRVGY